MFQRISDDAPTLRLDFEGTKLLACQGETVAAALLAAGVQGFRDTPVSGSPRAPYCMMGVCFDCLVEIDGMASRQACMTTVADGMVIRRQRGAHEVA